MPFIEAIDRLGYRIIAVDIDPKAPGFEFAEHIINLSAHDPDPIDQALRTSDINLGEIEAVFTMASRGCITTAAELAKRLGVSGPRIPPDSTDILVDRDKFRGFLQENTLPCPEFRVVSSPEQVEGMTYPLVVKSNINTSGSAGITLINQEDELPTAIAAAQIAGKTDYAIIEEFISGKDIGVFGIFQQGEPFFISTVERRVIDPPHFLPQYYISPAELSDASCQNLQDTFVILGKALGITAGPFYVEFRLNEKRGESFAIECEPTVPAHIDYLISKSSGVETGELVVLSLLNKLDGEPDIKVEHCAACKFLYAEKEGFLSEFDYPASDSIIVRKKVGDQVGFHTARDIIAVIYASADTKVKTMENIAEIERKMVIKTS